MLSFKCWPEEVQRAVSVLLLNHSFAFSRNVSEVYPEGGSVANNRSMREMKILCEFCVLSERNTREKFVLRKKELFESSCCQKIFLKNVYIFHPAVNFYVQM